MATSLARRAAAVAVVLLALAAGLAGCGDLKGEEIGGPVGSAVYTGSVRDGTVQVAIDPAWPTAGSGLWEVGREADGASDTMELQLERMGDAFPLGRYVDESIERSTRQVPGLRLLERSDVTLPSGGQATRLVLGTESPPARRFLVLVAVRGTTAASVVVLASAERFDELLADVEPYARTLRFV